MSVFEIFDSCGLTNCEMVLMENYPCENEKELWKRECEYILNNPRVNYRLPLKQKSLARTLEAIDAKRL